MVVLKKPFKVDKCPISLSYVYRCNEYGIWDVVMAKTQGGDYEEYELKDGVYLVIDFEQQGCKALYNMRVSVVYIENGVMHEKDVFDYDAAIDIPSAASIVINKIKCKNG